MRKPAVAGQFYEASKESLLEQVESCFTSELGPGTTKKEKRSKRVIGAICPHAGFIYSGSAAAYAYKEISASAKPDLIIIVGPNHTGMGRTSFTSEDFETPLGTVNINKEFIEILKKQDDIVEDGRAHVYEHSLEVQLPFLQHIFKDSFTFVPIVISSEVNIKSVAGSLKKAIQEYERNGKSVLIIASSDFAHQGPSYGYVPFPETLDANELKEKIKNLDLEAIELIKNLDHEGFMEYVKKTGITICGFLPIYILLSILKEKNPKSELLKYYTSGDISGDYTNSVSYASIVFRERNLE